MSRRDSGGSERVREEDVEKQGPKNDGICSEQKKIGQVNQRLKKIISKTWSKYFHWDVAFLVVCVVAVAVDPLFFYLPVIDKAATKCITIDETLEIIAICVRSFLDFIAIGDLVARKKNNCPHMKSSDYVINILAILPLPQVLVPIIFSKMRGSKFRHARKFLNAVVLLQYMPRLFRIYRLWKIVNENIILRPTTTRVKVMNAESYMNIMMIPPKGFIVMKAGFNLFLYLVASHILGAFWYFFSIERETTCWHVACKHDTGCNKTSFNCGHGFCPLEKPNTTLFDFGIFQEARQSGILESMDFPRKTMFCFWWGLRNLSSLGQNLETSSYYWENCFTVLISIFGLIMFLYFIGNLQVYMQWEVYNELEEISKRSKSKQHIKSMSKRLEASNELEEISTRSKSNQHIKSMSKRLEASNELEEISTRSKSNQHIKSMSKRLEASNELEEISTRSKSRQHIKSMSKRFETSNRWDSSKRLETSKKYYLTYMDEEDTATNIKRTKLRSIECWISTIGLSDQLKQMIMSYVTPILEDQKKHIDTENPFPHLPTTLRRLIKLHLCLPLLRRVSIFEDESEELLFEITCKFLKQVHYNQSKYIVREGEPLDALVFMVKGIAWTYTSNHGNKTECLMTGDLFGRHLVDWVLKSRGLSDLPLSMRTLKCHTKVEGFCLMASDLKDMMSQFWWKFRKFSHITQSNSHQLKHFAASSIQAAWRRHAIHPHKVLE